MPKIDWKRVLHVGASSFLIAMAGLAYLGIQLPGIHVDPTVAFASGLAGLGILGAGFSGPRKE